MIDDYIRQAHDYHDTLVKMGGRPTRPVLEHLAGKTIYDTEESRMANKAGEFQGTVALDKELFLNHWMEEWSRFQEELEQWKEFRDFQRNIGHQPLLKIAFDPEDLDQRLVEIITRLNDWREFQHYQQVKVGHAAMLTWRITRAMGKLMGEETLSDDSTSSDELQYRLSTYLRQLFGRRQGLKTSETQLVWIENQIPEILSETCTLLETALPLQIQLEVSLKQQADAFYQELKTLEARPEYSAQSPHRSADVAQKISHWGLEISRLMQEWWEWKIFLKWRTMQPHTLGKANSEEQESNEQSSNLSIWVDLVAYRHFQLDRTRIWVASWQRLVKANEDEMKITSEDDGLALLQDSTARERIYVNEIQGDIQIAESQVRLAEQQLAQLSSRQSSSTTAQIMEHTTSNPRMPSNPLELGSPETVQRNLEISDLRSSPAKDHGARGSTESYSSEIPESKATRELSTTIHQVPRLRKTRSGTKREQTVSNRVTKSTDKKSVKKLKPFTKEQNATLLDAALIQDSPKSPSSMSASERLNGKAPATTSPFPQLYSEE